MCPARIRRLTTEECPKLDASVLLRDGVFRAKPGTLWTSTWTDANGQEILRATLWLVQKDDGKLALRLVYGNLKALPAPPNRLLQTMELVTTRCHFGGQRFWFLCPLVWDGIPCRKRVRVLYLPPNALFFGCRTCYDLTYTSCQEHDKRVNALLKMPDEFWRFLTSDDLKQRLLAFRAGTLVLHRMRKKPDSTARRGPRKATAHACS